MSENDTLSPDEQARFDELFTANDRLQFTHDWKRILQDALASERLADPMGIGDDSTAAGFDADIVDLATERERRRNPVQLLAIAAAGVLIAGLAAFAVLNAGSTDTDGVQELALLGPDREIAPPQVTTSDLPENTTVVVDDDQTFALTTADDTTTVFASDDGIVWNTVATLPIVDATFGIDSDRMAIAGAAPDGLVDQPGVPGVRIATQLVAFVSADGGENWDEFDIALPEPAFPNAGEAVPDGSFVAAEDVTVAVHGDRTVVSFTSALQYDFTPAARDLGLIGPEDRIVRINDGVTNFTTFGVGPDTFGPVDIQPEDIGLPRHAFDDLILAPAHPESHVQVLSDGSGFAPVLELEAERHLNPIVASDEQGFYYLGATSWVRVYRSTDGTNWELINVEELADALGETIEVTSDWSLASDVVTGQVSQSIEGGRFRPVPVPATGLRSAGLVETDFGAAIVWQDIDAAANAVAPNRFEVDGFTIEQNFQGSFTVTDPAGNVLVEERGQTVAPSNGVVIDAVGSMQIFDANGERVLLVPVEDLFGRVLTSASTHYVGWSTDGEDWKFAELEIPAGPWVFNDTPDGLLGVNALTLTDGVVIDWPAEFDG